MSAVNEENMDTNNEDRQGTAVHPSGQNGDSQIITTNDGAEFKMTERRTFEEMCRKRKKHRRGKPKKKQWLRRKNQSDKEGESPQIAMKRRRANVFLHGQPAPNNTTQFIMEDHTDLQLPDFIKEKHNVCTSTTADKTGRARDSSFSVDSDDEFYSSPEDEEEFLTKEFSSTYEDVHVERLGTMTKAELIEEYLQLEKRVDSLEKKLKISESSKTHEQGGSGTGNDSDGEIKSGELHMEPDTAEKIRIFQEEINKLLVANEELAKENNKLRASSAAGPPSPYSSVDSESDSSSSTGTSHSSSSGSHKSKTSRTSEDRKSRSSRDSRVEESNTEQVQVREEKSDVDSQIGVCVEPINEPVVNGNAKKEEDGKKEGSDEKNSEKI